MKYFFLENAYSAPWDIPGGSPEDAVTLTQSDCSIIYGIYDDLAAKYPELPKNEILGRIKPNGGEGMFADFLGEEGLWALTLETPWCMPVIGKTQYDAPTIRCAVDVLANTILAIVRSYK